MFFVRVHPHRQPPLTHFIPLRLKKKVWELSEPKDPLAALAKALECWDNPGSALGLTVCFQHHGAKILQNMWEGLLERRLGWMWCACARHPASATSRGSAGPHGKAFFLPHQEGAIYSHRGIAAKALAETLKACALIT